MHLAYQYGADRIWVVNVGDLKPMEVPIQFFLDYAWDPEALSADGLQDYLKAWADREFGASHAGKIAQIVAPARAISARRRASSARRRRPRRHHSRRAEPSRM